MKKITSSIILLLTVFQLWAAWNPPVINYDRRLYGNGAQTWEIASYGENWIYFANKTGLIEFNGNSWNVYPIHNLSEVRSVTPSPQHNRVYVGAVDEFGYIASDKCGNIVYTCLSDSLPSDQRSFGNVWNIIQHNDNTYFVADNAIITLTGKRFSFLKVNEKIECSAIVNGALFLGTDKGLRILGGNSIISIKGTESLDGKRLREIIPYNNGALILTAYSGIYMYDGHSLRLIETNDDEFIREAEAFCGAYSNNKIAIGTIHNGVVVADLVTKELQFINESNGLRDNTVLSLAFDNNGNLWVGSDNGISMIQFNSPITQLYTYPHSYGAGYSAAVYKGMLYLGTNRGLYCMPFSTELHKYRPDIKSVPNTSGQVWSLSEIDGELLCMHDRGLFRIDNGKAERIGDISGVWMAQKAMADDKLLLVGTYSGMYLMQRNNGTWTNLGPIKGFDISANKFEQESKRVIWVDNVTTKVRIELSPDLRSVVGKESFSAIDGTPLKKDSHLVRIEDNIYFTTDKGLFRYSPTTHDITYDAKMDKLLKNTPPATEICVSNEKAYSLNPYELRITRLGQVNRGQQKCGIPIVSPQLELIPTFENLFPIGDSLVIVPNAEGFALISQVNSIIEKDYANSVQINSVSLTNSGDSLIYKANYLNRRPQIEIDYDQNSIRFDYGLTTKGMGEYAEFRFRLNDEEWSAPSASLMKEFSNLHEGHYRFEVQAVYPNGQTASDFFEFTILPPWYRSLPAYIVYGLLALLAAWMAYRWDDIRLNRKKRVALAESHRKIKEMEEDYEREMSRQEQYIVSLQKEKLEHELMHKNQETVNLMINFVRKNEMLNEIKSEIARVASSLKTESLMDSKRQLFAINSKIDSNIESDEVLKRIEEQFDLVHNNFMQKLQERHPGLSTNERMLCAYLKMNLSTKEIAPLLNISQRGVETVRYRLRKKLGLERSDNLTEYLNSI